MTLFVPPLLGATVVFEASANPSEIIRTTRRSVLTALIAVPRMLDVLRTGIGGMLTRGGHAQWFKRHFRKCEGQEVLRRAWMFRRTHRGLGWKFWAFLSGARRFRRTRDFSRRMGYAVVQGYGMTESASLISLITRFRSRRARLEKFFPAANSGLPRRRNSCSRRKMLPRVYWEKVSCNRLQGK